MSEEVVILSAKRTPFGTFGGTLKNHSATDLAVVAAKAALETASMEPAKVDQVILGNVVQSSADAIYFARHVGLRAGIPEHVPALTVNRLCGSGFQAVVSAAEQIRLGEAEVVLAGGSESMSQAPHVIRGARWGIPFGKGTLEDSLWQALTDSWVGLPMAITAESLARKYGVSREDADDLALTSQRRWAAAQAAGRFDAELAPVEVKVKGGTKPFGIDEHPRPQSTPEGLAKLAPVFDEKGIVTAGNASGICDGAAALVVASLSAAKRHGCEPLARVVDWGIVGCDPKIMGIGPAPAVRRALARTGWKLEEIDLFEVNEAFAPQYVAVERELGLDREKTNVDGGAIAVGHPLGASGARITAHLVHELRRRGGSRAVGSACIGGGQGIALCLERG